MTDFGLGNDFTNEEKLTNALRLHGLLSPLDLKTLRVFQENNTYIIKDTTWNEYVKQYMLSNRFGVPKEGTFKNHYGKHPLDWSKGKWSILSLSQNDFERLHVGPNGNRIYEDYCVKIGTLKEIAKGAINNPEKHIKNDRGRINDFRNGRKMVDGNRRIGICDYQDKHFSYFLNDGFGRALPYMMLVLMGEIKYEPVEAYYVRV